MTALEIVNDVQRVLRMPVSAAITEPHARLLLSFCNLVMRDFMLESFVWDELKVFGNFDTSADNAIYSISSTRGDIDVISNIQIGTDDPLANYNDENFRAYKRTNTNTGQPLVYRHYGRNAGAVLIEVSPTPDAVYTVDVETLIKPPKLVNSTDVPLLDPDTIVLGCVMLARKDQGEDYSGDLQAFQAKLALQGGTQGESNFGDVEAV